MISPVFTFELGVAPYTCNVPNVVFLEAATPLGGDRFKVKFMRCGGVMGQKSLNDYSLSRFSLEERTLS